MAGIAMGLKCPVCAAEDRADSEYESARSDNKADGAFQTHPQGDVLFGTPLRRGSSEYHLRQVRHRRRFLMAAKNHAVATRRLLGQAPSLEIRGRYAMAQANLWRGTCGGANIGWQSAARPAGANPQL